MSNKKKLFLGVSSDYLYVLVTTIIGFLVVPFYLKHVSLVEYGVWLAVFGLIQLLTMANLAVDQYLVNIITKDELFYSKKMSKYLNTTFLIKSLVAGLFLFVGMLMFYFLVYLINLETKFIDRAQTIFILVFINLILNLYASTLQTILNARLHFMFVNTTTFISSITNSIGVILFLQLGCNIISFPLATLIGSLIAIICQIIFFKINYPKFKWQVGFSFIDFKAMLRYSLSFQLLTLVHTLRTQYVTVIINKIVSPIALSQYNLSSRLPQMAQMLASKLVMPFHPHLSQKYDSIAPETLQRDFVFLNKIVMRFSLFSFLTFLAIGMPFMNIWLGVGKNLDENTYFVILTYTLFISSFSSFGIIIYITKKFQKWTLWSVVEVIVALVLSYFLGLRYGVFGVVLGLFLASFINQLYLIKIVLAQLKFKPAAFFKSLYKFVILPNIPTVILVFLIREYYTIDSWLPLIISGSVILLSQLLVYELPLLIKHKFFNFKNAYLYKINQ
ncbi:MAG: oligosaccharide flippase family protein [Sphingobacteriaceae bacterium]|nr:oligosaccharide flippase family protein [Sphingobacteriaceae bacterium]